MQDAKALARQKNKEKSKELLGETENTEVITNMASLSVSKGDFVRLNNGLFDDFYTIGRIIGIGKTDRNHSPFAIRNLL